MEGAHIGGYTPPGEGCIIDHLYSAPKVIVDHNYDFTRDQIAYNRWEQQCGNSRDFFFLQI